MAQPELEELTRRTGETSALMVWNKHESVVVEQVPSPKQVKHTASVGTRYDTYQSSSVQVFLAEMPRVEVQRLFDRRLVVGPDDAQAVDMYLDELGGARERGYAVNDGRTSIEEVGISAPVHDHRGVLVAAIMLSPPIPRAPAMLEPLGRAVADAARQVSVGRSMRRWWRAGSD